MQLKSLAEQKLLASLSKPRIPQGKNGTQSNAKSAKYENELSADSIISNEEFSVGETRYEDKLDPYEIEKLRSVAEVHALQHQKLDKIQPASNYEKIQKNVLDRRDRHGKLHDMYHGKVKEISDELEEKLLLTSDSLKEALENIDNFLASTFRRIQDASWLVKRSHDDILKAWTGLKQSCSERTATIENYSESLEGLEKQRAEAVRTELHNLTESMITTAYILPPEVERLIETEAHELNIVLIANRQSYAELVTRLLEADVHVSVQTRLKWEKCERQWRKIRHEDAISRFEETISSELFTNPAERKDILNRLGAELQDRHSKQRMNYVTLIKTMDANSISSKELGGILKSFEELHREEEDRNQYYFEQLQSAHQEKGKEGRDRRENLRLLLHSFGAEAEEGLLKEKQTELVNCMKNDHGIDTFLVKSGSLRAELQNLIDLLGSNQVFYSKDIVPYLPRLELVVAALSLADILEEQGKANDRKAIQASLEKLRMDPKKEAATVLPILLQQVRILMNNQKLPEIMHQEFVIMNEQLELLLDVSESLASSKGSSLSDSSPKTPALGGGGDSVLSSAQSHTIQLQSSTCSNPTMHTLLADVRAVRFRLGMLMYATDLNVDLKELLPRIYHALTTQIHANEVVDGVIERMCDPLLELRQTQGLSVIAAVGQAIETQGNQLNETCEHLCKEYSSVASIWETHVKQIELKRNMFFSELDKMEEKFQGENEEAETNFRESESILRHSPDTKTLESSSERCISCLDSIENGYREYHNSTSAMCGKYPASVEYEEREFLTLLCSEFGLISPYEGEFSEVDGKASKDESEGESNPVEDAKKEVIQDPQGTQPNTENDVPISREFTTPGSNLTTIIQTSFEDLVQRKIVLGSWGNEGTVENLEETVEEGAISSTGNDVVGNAVGENSSNIITGSEIPDSEDAEFSKEEVEENKEDKVDGFDFVPSICIPFEELVGMFASLRDSMFNKQHETGTDNIETAKKESEDFMKEYTLELEEHLRRHWPRKGRLNVKVYQPREGELIVHRQRSDRFIRSLLRKVDTLVQRFEKALESGYEHISNFHTEYVALRAQLPMQTSLAALQGLEKRAKQNCVEYAQESKDEVRKLRALVDEEPEQLFSSTREFLAQCRQQVFPSMEHAEDVVTGMDYHPDELKMLEQLFEQTRTGIESRISQCRESLETFSVKQSQIDEIDQNFKKRFQHCMKALSMKEGLGQKYGAPRRNAQERIRSECARSQEASDNIDHLITDLKVICQTFSKRTMPNTEPQKLPNTLSQWKRGRTPSNVSVQIRHTLLRLRRLLFSRAKYLDFLKFDPSVEANKRVHESKCCLVHNVWNEVCPDLEGTKRLVDKDPQDEELSKDYINSFSTFLQALDMIEEKCRVETRQLFHLENPSMDIEEITLPESLKKYLEEQRIRAISFREQQSRALREQVQELERILKNVIDTYFEDTSVRCRNEMLESCQEIEAEFREKYKASQRQRESHEKKLTPGICSPHRSAEVDEVCSEEHNRTINIQEEIVQTHQSLLKVQEDRSSLFEKRLIALSVSWMEILDSILLEIDLGSLPGDDLIVHKRKSLKRLRKAVRKEDEQDSRTVVENSEDTVLARFQRRKWPGIPEFGTLCKVPDAKKILLRKSCATESKEGSEEGEGEEETPSSTSVDDKLSEDENDGRKVAFLTHLHRFTIRKRDECYASFREFYVLLVEQSSEKFQDLINSEELWTENWNKMIRNVREEDF